jgi:hypothetical protein
LAEEVMTLSTPDYREHTRSLAWGLNLDEPDVTSAEEIEEFRRVSAAQLGMQQDGLDFWLDTSPDVLKRYRLWAHKLRVMEDDESPNKWSPSGIAIMYTYAMTGFEDGIRYSLHGMNRTMTKAQILEQMALVFRYSGPRGMFTLARAAREHAWREPTDPVRWPKGWGPDPEAFKSGADFRSPGVSQQDVDQIVAWYERWLTEVPRHISFLARHRPELLKAYRNRYENTLRVLPKQTEPWALLQISIQRGFAGGIREGMLLARGFGVSRAQILEAISWGTFYGGHESLNLVDEVAGDVLDSWPA